MMKIGVGSTNKSKVAAVRDLISAYPALAGAEVVGLHVSSGVADQPQSLGETIRGASNRAKAAFVENDLGIGIEAGVFEVPEVRSRYLNVTIAVVYDGASYVGMSSGFEWPQSWIKLMQTEGLTVRDAAFKTGFTDDENIAHEGGLVGLLTNGRVTRKDYVQEALRMALMQFEYKRLYLRKVICSICSREKAEGLVPAGELYRGAHIRLVEGLAKAQDCPFFILSGVYGFVDAGQLIKSYDHLLQPDEVAALASTIEQQLAGHDIGEIEFYTKDKPNWWPYRQALELAAEKRAVCVQVHELGSND